MNFLIDFDDTIVNSGEAHEAAYKLTFEYFNLPLTLLNYSLFSGRSTHNVLSDFIADKDTLERAILFKKNCYLSFVDKKYISIKEGFLEFQEYLNKTGQAWGVVSGGSRSSISKVCELYKIKPSLGIISSENYFKSKPSPEPYQIAIRTWNLKNVECIVIEDSLNGINSAISANIQCFSINPKIYNAKVNAFADWKSLYSYVKLNINND